jgi:hypothetical protein
MSPKPRVIAGTELREFGEEPVAQYCRGFRFEDRLGFAAQPDYRVPFARA